MSTCISSAGEFSSHEPGDHCPLCGVFNEEAVLAERDRLRAAVDAALFYLDTRYERLCVDDPDPSRWVPRDELFDALSEARADQEIGSEQ